MTNTMDDWCAEFEPEDDRSPGVTDRAGEH
jgi:hypothetical protein